MKCESKSHTLRDSSNYLIKCHKGLTACDEDIVLMECSVEDPLLWWGTEWDLKLLTISKWV